MHANRPNVLSVLRKPVNPVTHMGHVSVKGSGLKLDLDNLVTFVAFSTYLRHCEVTAASDIPWSKDPLRLKTVSNGCSDVRSKCIYSSVHICMVEVYVDVEITPKNQQTHRGPSNNGERHRNRQCDGISPAQNPGWHGPSIRWTAGGHWRLSFRTENAKDALQFSGPPDLSAWGLWNVVKIKGTQPDRLIFHRENRLDRLFAGYC